MVSKITLLFGFSALVLLILQTVSIATPNWFVVDGNGQTYITVGLFDVCVTGRECLSYIEYVFKQQSPSFSYIAFIGLNVLGCVFNFVSIVMCFAHAVSGKPCHERSFIQRTASLWITSGSLLLGAVVWIYLSLIDVGLNDVLTDLSITPGYSFYIACLVAVLHLVAAIAMFIHANRMPVPPMTTGFVTAAAPPMLVMQTNTIANPPVSKPEHPQNIQTDVQTSASYGLPQSHPSYGYDQA
ncbi:uncharacterized protein LOC132561883 [Ylistrum balloti]|uniref:uncharacterized protein LOC132561883 n=1 Tax=Ylistrum balloti TaxID=509963 RepID=UPI0029059F8C|nr:uncharacterized protein LOC132561883 [Ylistrum balloti]